MVAFRNTMEHIEAALVQEMASLQAHQFGDIKDFNDQKSRGLLEVTRAARGITPGMLDADDRERLRRLRARLEENQHLLLAHLNAAREIAEVVSAAMHASESDGTYTARMNGRETAL